MLAFLLTLGGLVLAAFLLFCYALVSMLRHFSKLEEEAEWKQYGGGL